MRRITVVHENKTAYGAEIVYTILIRFLSFYEKNGVIG